MNMSRQFILPNSPLALSDIRGLMTGEWETLTLAQEVRDALSSSHEFLKQQVKTGKTIYGVNTGFGYLCDTRIGDDQLRELQLNLIRSHACGTGDVVPEEIVRIMLFLKIRSLGLGYSGVRHEVVDRLIQFFNHRVHPVVFTQGSLGASGDLAPLAALSLPLIGEGEVWLHGERVPASRLRDRFGWVPLHLEEKEGLALLNGTQFMLSYALWAVHHANRLAKLADRVACLSLEAWGARHDPFHPALHRIRPHAGQVQVAADILHILSQGKENPEARVQDPYSFRCIPQVHGAVRDTLSFCGHAFETELNSVSDNPHVFPDEGRVLSGGNFHGQPIAMPLDYLAIALSELGSISERRTYLMLSGAQGLPLFLSPDPGLHSGLMIVQYSAASIASENKIHASPASVDSIPSSNGQEDHVSMGAVAAVKSAKVVENVYRLLGMELICASQALSLRKHPSVSPALQPMLDEFRNLVPPVTHDRVLSGDIALASDFLKSFVLNS